MENEFQDKLDPDALLQSYQHYESIVSSVLEWLARGHGESGYLGLQGRWTGVEYNAFVEYANPKWDIVANNLNWFYQEGIKLKNIILGYKELPLVEPEADFAAVLRGKLELSDGQTTTWSAGNSSYIGYIEQEKNTAYNAYAAPLWIQSEVFYDSSSSSLEDWSAHYGKYKHEKTENIFNTIQDIYDEAVRLDKIVAQREEVAHNRIKSANEDE